MAVVFIGCPTHGGQLDSGAARGVYLTATEKHTPIEPQVLSRSLLNANCNTLLAMAWNNRHKYGIQWFCMLHSDITPKVPWVDVLIDEALAHDADMISAVVPIKDARGVTSTALSTPDDPWGHAGRLSLHQVLHPSFPKTFDASMAADALEAMPEPYGVPFVPRRGLWLNTGCMAFRLDRPWKFKTRANPDGIGFSSVDYFDEDDGGKLTQCGVSEDWLFADSVIRQGGRCFATTKVPLDHRGVFNFSNERAMGSTVNEFEVKIVEVDDAAVA